MKTYFFTHDSCLKHNAGLQHPERPQRLQSIYDSIRQQNISLEKRVPYKACSEHLTLAHSDEHVKRVLDTSGKSTSFDADTKTNESSVDAALYAAGACIESVDLVLQNPATTTFCAVRPPGHHAESNRAMGFCLFNSAAVAAAYAIKHKNLQRVLIFDPDVHHGNGSQEIFYKRRDVFYTSIHQYPHYPGTGAVSETGEGAGLGYNLNFPLRSGEGDDTYIYLAQNAILGIIKNFQPQLIIFSAGFDSHKLDPLANMEVTSLGFCQMYTVIMHYVLEQKIPFFYTLEGGYSLEGLSSSTTLLLETITTENWPRIPQVKPSAYVESLVEKHSKTFKL
ncbi:histone deacetylase [Candidatus Uabimicrobium sp. HlEnr_7]|uniref:histone deacetylase family protein n=1 Tax=Candidatus Uabimicrobium helgolandensis TaxID=3095367 RepID=UPI0035568BFA